MCFLRNLICLKELEGMWRTNGNNNNGNIRNSKRVDPILGDVRSIFIREGGMNNEYRAILRVVDNSFRLLDRMCKLTGKQVIGRVR